MKKVILIGILSIVCSTIAKADNGQHRHLSLDESIEIAKGQSLRMLKLEQSLKRAEYDLEAAVRSLKTNIDLELGLPQYSDDVLENRYRDDETGEWILDYYSVKQLGYTGDLTINQPLPTDGRIYIQNRVSSFDDMTKYDEGKRGRSTRASTRIGLQQPLDAFYGFNSIKATLKRAKLAHEQSSKSLKRAELNLVYDVSSAYYSLLSLQESANIALMDLDRQTEAYDMSKNKYAAGLIREVDALQMEVDLAEAQNRYDIAVLNQTSSVNRLKELLGISLQDSITLKSSMDYNIVIIDPNIAVQFALDNRLEIREQEIQLELQQINIKQQKAQRIVKASVNAHFEQVGIDQPTMSGGQNRAYNGRNVFPSIGHAYQDYSDRPSNFGLGVTVRIPILDWGQNRSRVRAAQSVLKEIEYTKEETERSIETEVINLVADINSNLKRLQLLEKNVKVAEKSFEITRQRYSDGDIDSESLALERNRLNTAYTSRLNAFINYQLSLADIMRKTFYDFRTQELIQ